MAFSRSILKSSEIQISSLLPTKCFAQTLALKNHGSQSPRPQPLPPGITGDGMAICWTGAFYRRVAGWVAGGCWDDYETSDEMDHSRKFPAFSTSKMKLIEILRHTLYSLTCKVINIQNMCR